MIILASVTLKCIKLWWVKILELIRQREHCGSEGEVCTIVHKVKHISCISTYMCRHSLLLL